MKSLTSIAFALICFMWAGSLHAQKSTTKVDKMPEYPGGMTAMVEYLGGQIKYPEAAEKAGAEATIHIKFVVGTDGSVKSVSSITKAEDTREDMIMEAIRVIKSMPDWKPAMKDGKKVACEMVLPIKFAL